MFSPEHVGAPACWFGNPINPLNKSYSYYPGIIREQKIIFLAILNCGTLSKVGDFPRQAVARRSIAPSSPTCSWPSVPLPL
jgi:hypothetical protein